MSEAASNNEAATGMAEIGRLNSSYKGLAGVVQRNIKALLEVRQAQNSARSLGDKFAERVTVAVGSIAFATSHALLVVVWLVVNLGWTPIRPFDPFPFVMLAMIASVEAIFLTTFVLITQNRMQRAADRRAELDLQISLLAEHEITRLVAMVQEISTHLGLRSGADPELEELKRDIAPEEVLDTIEQAEKEES